MALGVEEGVALGVLEGVADTLGVAEGVRDGVADTLGVALTLGVAEGVLLGVALTLGVADTLGVEDGVLLTVAEGVLEGVAEGVRDGVLEGVLEGVALGVAETLGVALTLGVLLAVLALLASHWVARTAGMKYRTPLTKTASPTVPSGSSYRLTLEISPTASAVAVPVKVRKCSAPASTIMSSTCWAACHEPNAWASRAMISAFKAMIHPHSELRVRYTYLQAYRSLGAVTTRNATVGS